jgi:Transposase
VEQDQLHRVLDVQVSALGTAAPGELASVSGPSQLRVRVNRRLLLTAAEHLSAKQWKRLGRMLDEHDPTNEIGAAWGVKERLRMLLAESEPSKIRRRLADFYDAAIDAQLPEPPDWPTPSRPGGRPSWSPSPRTPPTPAPKASTASSNKPSGSAAAA